MATIEERAKVYSLKDFDGYYTGREKAMEEGYIAGATEQKAIDDAELLKLKSSWEKEAQVNYDDEKQYKQGYHDAIKDACEWLDSYFEELGQSEEWERDYLRPDLGFGSGKERFIKAMGE